MDKENRIARVVEKIYFFCGNAGAVSYYFWISK